MLCPYCARKISKWRLQCRVCRRNVWRLPHIVFFTVLGITGFAGLIWIVEFLATRR